MIATSSRRLLAGVATVAAGAAMTACADKEQDFKHDFRALNARILALGHDVREAVSGASSRSDRQLSQQFGVLARRTGRLQRRADELDPPNGLSNDESELVDALGDTRDSLRGVEEAARDSDPPAARRATLQLLAGLNALRSARLELARATGAKR